MVESIVHTAVARKMLCKPVNSLIADTEFVCAVGMLMRLLKAGKEAYTKAEGLQTTWELQGWLFQNYEQELSGEFDMPVRNLIEMISNYRTEEKPLTMQLKRLLLLGYENEIVYPRGRFL